MRFGVLGPLKVWTDDGRAVRVPELKVRALLADLLLHEGRPVAVDRLIGDLWGEFPPGKPGGALRAKVSQLRRALEEAESGGRDLVVFGPSGYLIQTEPDSVDAVRFQRLLGRAHATGEARARAALLSEALALWRGPALSDFADEEFAWPVIARLEEQRLTALEVQAEARLDLGEHSLLVGELADLVALHPLRERLRAAQMRALYRSGRQSEALQSYQDLRRRLRDEQGLDPGSGLAALFQAILEQDPALEPAPAPGPRAAHHRSNLPASVTELIGRSQAVTGVVSLLGAGRLVTLTGPGGVGKTSLALEVAAQLVGAYPEGVWIVELAGRGRHAVPDTATAVAEAVAEGVAEVMGIRDDAVAGSAAGGSGQLIGRLTGALRGARVLLVLDNCEHVVDGVAEVAGLLLRAAPELRVLATSQEPLGVPGEQLWPVPPLDLPDSGAETEPAALEESSAVRLFVQRASAAAPGFVLDGDTAPAVAAICRRLDGIPLALELAATRVRALGVRELANRLDDRFRLLSSGARRAPARQRTLRATIDWSWNLLSDPERTVLRRLSVHSDGCSLEAAEAVCSGAGVAAGDVLDLLARLVDRSLVTVAESKAGGPRYRLLESVAAYCAERLAEAGEAEWVRDRHARHYTELAERADPHLRGHRQREWLRRLDEETSNLRDALETATRRRDAQLALRLADATAWYRYLRGRLRECRRALGAALAIDGPAPVALRAKVTVWHAGITLIMRAGSFPVELVKSAQRHCEEIDEPADRARAQWFVAFALSNMGEEAVSRDLMERATAGFRALGDQWGVAAVLSLRTWHALMRADLAVVEGDGGRSLRMFRALGDLWGQVQATSPLATLAVVVGDYERAARLHREALRVAEDLGLWPEVAWQLSGLGRVAMLTGDHAGSREFHERAMRIAAGQSDAYGEKYAELGLGLGARREGRLDAAERHLRNVLDWIASEEAGGVALIMAELGYIAELRGEVRATLTLQLNGFAAARASRDPRAIALALEGLAGAEALAGHHRHAVRLLGAAGAARQSVGVPLPAAERGDIERTTTAVRAVLNAEEFEAELELGAALEPGELVRQLACVTRLGEDDLL
ncbi:SARP family transcriptional regulator [Microtetraspora sp. NBRC 13810]|uniref:BTAD domain-containing putative transcriptional regulator n=1 Tax=Microtetraspora sp. NBRC 13810 TaxID=3030990 RepID=UPI0024A1DE8C|nr:BTAD domain-containing putative transcriptional regulator [Microtetraspora sp. NBRC 13810]GLW09403.1 SARP family transcriptional regulator [Microtetraspora sp. NBRC 13810]